MSSQIFWGPDLNRVKFDVKFTETINQCMQVPNKLQILEQSTSQVDGVAADDQPLSFQMRIPERISLAGVEMMEIGLRPFQFELLSRRPEFFTPAPRGLSMHAPISTEFPSLKTKTKAGSRTQRRQSRTQTAQTNSENILTATRAGPNGQEMCSCPVLAHPVPPFAEDGRIYSLSNVCRILHCLGCLLFRRLQSAFYFPSHPSLSSREENAVCRQDAQRRLPPPSSLLPVSTQNVDPNTVDRPVEDIGLVEIIAMKKMLTNISGRLQILEEERAGGYPKELLIYTALLTACLINTLLWMRK
ncbi:mitochondrial fission factor-like isoform X2 [Ambystoma mexicanum]|uniref:mitochondrial fission factor-like isoform X2 n=1 Tax=Ambystoma mexicanum TaxID=8296 RepID=UPI0037E770D2